MRRGLDLGSPPSQKATVVVVVGVFPLAPLGKGTIARASLHPPGLPVPAGDTTLEAQHLGHFAARSLLEGYTEDWRGSVQMLVPAWQGTGRVWEAFLEEATHGFTMEGWVGLCQVREGTAGPEEGDSSPSSPL